MCLCLVCVAVHRELGIKVAVKFYKEGGIKELEEELAIYRDLELFAVGLIQEGQSVKANHVKQHFLNVLLSGTEGPFPWMVLPKGSASLQAQVPSTGFSLGLCRRIIAQAVTALSALKEVGRLHLDVKATNFLFEIACREAFTLSMNISTTCSLLMPKVLRSCGALWS